MGKGSDKAFIRAQKIKRSVAMFQLSHISILSIRKANFKQWKLVPVGFPSAAVAAN